MTSKQQEGVLAIMEEISGCGAHRGFGSTARFYELLSRVFSGGLIERAKQLQLKSIKSESRVLYLGVGAGEDALLAAKMRAHVTCIDISAGMLEQLRRKMSSDLKVELICGDAFQHDRLAYYDFVVCNFFLNCFQEAECIRMLKHASSLLRDGGKLLIADVASPRGNHLSRFTAHCYIKSGMIFYWILGMVSLHGIYDYRNYLQQAGLELWDSTPHRLAMIGPVVYENIVAHKMPSTFVERG